MNRRRSTLDGSAFSWRRLRVRIAVSIGGVAALLSVGLGVGTYVVVRAVLIEERQSGAVQQVQANSRLVATAVRSVGVSETEVLASFRPQVRSRPLLFRNDEWFTASLQIQPDQLPAGLVDDALAGVAARQRFVLDDQTVLGVAIPIEGDRSAYFEVFLLADLDNTLDTLAVALLVGSVLATCAGAALGLWIGGRVVRPLDAVSAVAEQIAAGSLDSRLSAADDLDLQRLSTSFNAMADALEQRVQRETRFASDVSHELRSPLTTLLTSAAVLERRRHELSDDGQEALALLVADLGRFQRMVVDLTEMSKHDAGMFYDDRSEVNLVDLVNRTLRRMRRSHIEVAVDPSAAGALVDVQESALERVVTNLVENAELHADHVERITIRANPSTLRVTVDDIGPGVPAEFHERIFDRFARVGDGRQAAPGSGLGLALSAETVSALGGRMWCEANPAGGARFVVELPRSDQ